MLEVFLFEDAIEIGARGAPPKGGASESTCHQTSTTSNSLTVEDVGDEAGVPVLPALPALVGLPAPPQPLLLPLPPPGMTRQDGDERHRPLFVLKVGLIPPQVWARWTVVFSCLFVLDAVVVVVLSALALSMIRPRLSQRCFDVPLRYTASYTNMAYGAFSAFFSTALLFMAILIRHRNIAQLAKFIVYWVRMCRSQMAILLLQAASSVVAGLSSAPLWVIFVGALPISLGALDFSAFLYGSVPAFIPTSRMTLGALCLLSVSLYVHIVSQRSPCVNREDIVRNMTTLQFFGFVVFLFSNAVFQVVGLKLFVRKLLRPRRPSVAGSFRGQRFLLIERESRAGGSAANASKKQLNLMILHPDTILIIEDPGSRSKDELRRSLENGAKHFYFPAAREDRVRLAKSIFSAVCAGVCMLSLALTFMRFRRIRFEAASKCFRLLPIAAAIEQLEAVRLAIYITSLLASAVTFIGASKLRGIYAAILAFWARRQFTLVCLIVPVWFLFRRLVTGTANLVNDVSLLVVIPAFAGLDVLVIAGSRVPSPVFSAAVRAASGAIAIELMSVYCSGVAVSFRCTEDEISQITLFRFGVVKFSDFLNAIFAVELIGVLLRRIASMRGSACQFANTTRVIVRDPVLKF